MHGGGSVCGERPYVGQGALLFAGKRTGGRSIHMLQGVYAMEEKEAKAGRRTVYTVELRGTPEGPPLRELLRELLVRELRENPPHSGGTE